MSKFIVLLVEGNMLQREVMSELFRNDGFEVLECASDEAAELERPATGNGSEPRGRYDRG